MDDETRDDDRGSALPLESEDDAAAAARTELDADVRAERLRERGQGYTADEDEPPLGGPAH